MGVMDNFRKILESSRYRNKERTLEREVTKSLIEDKDFYDEYGAFIDGLVTHLDTVLIDEGHMAVELRPKQPMYAKYFRAVLDDTEMNANYVIEKTSGGTFVFKLRDIKI